MIGWATVVLSQFKFLFPRFNLVQWLPEAATYLLWLGTLFLWLTLRLGLIAEETVPHVSRAYLDQYNHEFWAYRTAWTFSALSIWRYYFHVYKKAPIVSKWEGWLNIFAWTVGIAFLSLTAFYGGRLVFIHGVGVMVE